MRISPTEDELIALTARWKGERFPSGRPRVPDDVLTRLADTTSEHAWAVLDQEGYPRQFTGQWRETHPGRTTVGRAVTSVFLPHRPVYDAAVVAAGALEGHQEGDRQNSWIIEGLVEGDVMVTDIFGKVFEGTVIGDNLGTAVCTASSSLPTPTSTSVTVTRPPSGTSSSPESTFPFSSAESPFSPATSSSEPRAA